MSIVQNHEAQLRARKAVKLIDVFRRHSATAHQLEDLPDEGWVTAAQVAGVNVPSACTRRIVIETIREGDG